jgi:membrane-associated phospholipid phosphatase
MENELQTSRVRALARCTLLWLAACGVAVAIAVLWIDRPVALFVDRHGIDRFALLRWITLPPPIVQAWAPALLAALALRRAWGPLRPWERAALVAAVAVIVADQFSDSIKDVAGRYWPKTWIDHNPALIPGDDYGFHPFHRGPAYGDFPSGHTARTFAVASVMWIAAPRWRWPTALVAFAVPIALVGMDYHFVGDTIAGAFVGAAVGVWGMALAGAATRDAPG